MHTCLTQSEAVLELYRKERKKQLLKSKRVFKFVNREPKKAGKKPTGHEAGIGGQVSNGRRPLIRTLPFPFDSHQIYSFFLFFISFLSLSLSSPRGSRSHSLLSPLPAVGALSIRQRRRTNSSSSSSAPIGFVLEQVGEASASIDRSVLSTLPLLLDLSLLSTPPILDGFRLVRCRTRVQRVGFLRG